MGISSRRPVLRRGFTLLEVMVVTAISVLVSGVGVFVYMNCLRIYKDSQGVTSVYEMAKLFHRDMYDYLGCVVPVKGNWITPKTRLMPGQTSWDHYNPNGLLWYYTNYYCKGVYQNNQYTGADRQMDPVFSGPSDVHTSYGMVRPGAPTNWGTLGWGLWGYNDGQGANKGWWPPAFFGQRNGANTTVREKFDVLAGSWGWPQADYRLNADADKLASGTATLTDGANVACWFYAEDRYFNSPYTLALDNPNIVLCSVKFSAGKVNNREETQLSFLKHHLGGFDQPHLGGTGSVRSDAAYGNMLRAISITPGYLSAGTLRPMGDDELGCTLAGATLPTQGNEVPRCFDIRYRLQNPSTLQGYAFALRVYCRINPQ